MFPCPATLCRRYHTTKPIQIYCLRGCLWSPASWASDAGHLFGCFEILLQAVTKSMEVYGLALYQNIIRYYQDISRCIMHYLRSIQLCGPQHSQLSRRFISYYYFVPLDPIPSMFGTEALLGFFGVGPAWVLGSQETLGPNLKKLAASSVDPGPTGGLLYQFHSISYFMRRGSNYHQLSHMDASANMCKPSEQMLGDPLCPLGNPRHPQKRSTSHRQSLRNSGSPHWWPAPLQSGSRLLNSQVRIGADGRAVLEAKKNDQMAIGPLGSEVQTLYDYAMTCMSWSMM